MSRRVTERIAKRQAELDAKKPTYPEEVEAAVKADEAEAKPKKVVRKKKD